jgi:hypothetical protein
MSITRNIKIIDMLIHKHLHRKYGLEKKCYTYSTNKKMSMNVPVYGIYLEVNPNLKKPQTIANEIAIITSSVTGSLHVYTSVNYMDTYIWIRCHFILN